MINDINTPAAAPRNNKAFAGLFLIALGGIYLLRQLDFFFFPGWIFSWPMILIIVGIASGIKHNFRNPASYTLIAVGTIFLLGHILHIAFHFFWPVILVAIGVRMLLGGDNHWHRNRWERRHSQWHNNMNQGTNVDL